jgi:NAD-dependent DNA ligase
MYKFELNEHLDNRYSLCLETMNISNRICTIVKELEAASNAYYNGDTLLMSDDAYDQLRDELETLDPRHPFLERVGASVPVGAVQLPVKMPSLQKIKPGTGQVEVFASRGRSWIVSEKLDGLSLLWDSKSDNLYLRGDGVKGVSLRAFAPHIQGLVKPRQGCLVRGELLVRKTDAPPNIPLLRSWINGLVHQKQPDSTVLRLLRFVAYEVLEPRGLTRSQQIAWLIQNKFEIPWCMSTDSLSDESLKEILLERRAASVYEMDGIVVGEDSIPWVQSDDYRHTAIASLPKDMRAFKMPLDDQCAETVVKDVLWATSHQGYIIPRLEIQPIQVAGATIQYVTAHNARFIVENGLGSGARIEVRRSGDVIPTVHRILQRAEPKMPTKGTWRWDGDSSTAKHICLVNTEAGGKELVASKLTHFVRTLGVEDCGAGLITKLVDAEILDVRNLVNLAEDEFKKILGQKIGSKIYKHIHEKLATATEKEFLLASSLLPRGTGETKLQQLFVLEPDFRKWHSLKGGKIEGWSDTALQELLRIIPEYSAWRSYHLATVPLRLPSVSTDKKDVPLQGTVCFTGFRDKVLEAKCIELGWIVADTVNKKTTVLVVPDGEENGDSGKTKKAREYKTVRVIGRSAFQTQLLKSG